MKNKRNVSATLVFNMQQDLRHLLIVDTRDE